MTSALKFAVAILLSFLAISDLSSASLTIRTKRQVEREGVPASEVVVIRDKNGDVPSNTRYNFLPSGVYPAKPYADKDEEVDLKLDEDNGTFMFGGRLPDFHHFHGQFSQLFNIMAKHFDDMSKRFDQSFSSFSNTDIAKLPNNYNDTNTEIVEMGGKRFIKKKTTIKKGGPNTQIFITSTTYELVPDDNENVEPASEVGLSERPPANETSGSPSEGVEREA